MIYCFFPISTMNLSDYIIRDVYFREFFIYICIYTYIYVYGPFVDYKICDSDRY